MILFCENRLCSELIRSLQNLEASLHAQRAALTGASFLLVRKFPKGNEFILFASTKRTKSSRRAAALSTPGNGSKLYRLYFFVTFPALIPKPAYGATHFFGCFEPVRKGYCSADARPIFFENGIPHCKLTGASRIQKGQLLVIFVAVGICFCSVLIKCLEVSPRFLAFTQSCSALIESFDLSQSLVFVQKFRSI